MKGNGQLTSGDAQVLCWPGKLLSADDLRRHLTSQRELRLLPGTIVTPLAVDELRARGIRLSWDLVATTESKTSTSGWAFVQEQVDVAISAAVQALGRDGLTLLPLTMPKMPSSRWSRTLAELIKERKQAGIVAFCSDPGLVCCVANKLAGLRAVAVLTSAQATRARRQLAANFLAVEMPGRTFFEVRQILRACTIASECPQEITQTLQELEGHAHR